ncbi:hypothetical protein ACWDNR_24345, partial [Gordonia aichiensis]
MYAHLVWFDRPRTAGELAAADFAAAMNGIRAATDYVRAHPDKKAAGCAGQQRGHRGRGPARDAVDGELR